MRVDLVTGWLRDNVRRPLYVAGAVIAAVLLVMASVGQEGLRQRLGIAEPAPPELVEVSLRFAWPEYARLKLTASDEQLQRLVAALEVVEKTPAQTSSGGDSSMDAHWLLDLLWSDGTATRLGVTKTQRMFEEPSRTEWVGDDFAGEVAALAEELAAESFGKLMTWPQVAPMFPVGGRAQVEDLETGLTFTVRRHRGDSHADVEPLTAEDSEVLKRIYGGEWSWKRRAVIVTIGERRIAGSMNGMPHGWGDLFENQFVGHSCIHFWQSRVHGTWQEDPGHQLMVNKAAGLLTDLLDEASPEELASWALAAVNHRDVVSLRYMAWPEYPDGYDFYATFGALVRPLRHLAPHGSGRATSVDATSARVRVTLTAYYLDPDPDQGFLRDFHVELRRADEGAPWRVDLASLFPLVRRDGAVPTTGSLPAVCGY